MLFNGETSCLPSEIALDTSLYYVRKILKVYSILLSVKKSAYVLPIKVTASSAEMVGVGGTDIKIKIVR